MTLLMTRVVAIDLGTRRIGVAVSDPGGVLASPYSVLNRTGEPAADYEAIARIVGELGADRVLVGLPLSLDGSRGPAARAAEEEAAALGGVLDVPVELVDERLTTVVADRGMAARGVRSRKRRATVDQEAAAVLLQGWLDAR